MLRTGGALNTRARIRVRAQINHHRKHSDDGAGCYDYAAGNKQHANSQPAYPVFGQNNHPINPIRTIPTTPDQNGINDTSRDVVRIGMVRHQRHNTISDDSSEARYQTRKTI